MFKKEELKELLINERKNVSLLRASVRVSEHIGQKVLEAHRDASISEPDFERMLAINKVRAKLSPFFALPKNAIAYMENEPAKDVLSFFKMWRDILEFIHERYDFSNSYRLFQLRTRVQVNEVLAEITKRHSEYEEDLACSGRIKVCPEDFTQIQGALMWGLLVTLGEDRFIKMSADFNAAAARLRSAYAEVAQEERR